MRLRVMGIRRGYCEVWANDRDGGRYRQIAEVRKLDDGWRWAATDSTVLPESDRSVHPTRRGCVVDCGRTALLRRAEHAIESGRALPGAYWDGLCRVALRDMQISHLFSAAEMRDMRKMMVESASERGRAAAGSMSTSST